MTSKKPASASRSAECKPSKTPPTPQSFYSATNPHKSPPPSSTSTPAAPCSPFKTTCILASASHENSTLFPLPIRKLFAQFNFPEFVDADARNGFNEDNGVGPLPL